MNGRFEGLKAYEMAYAGAMKIFWLSKMFPKEECSLPDQIRRYSLQVCANTAEAYRKRRYQRHYVMKRTDADGEASETIIWLNFAKDCDFMDEETFVSLCLTYHEIGKFLGFMIDHPDKFGARTSD